MSAGASVGHNDVFFFLHCHGWSISPFLFRPRAFALPLFLRLLRPCLRQSTAQGSVEEEEELFCILGG